MTHPAAVRQEALARVKGGESANRVAQSIGVNRSQLTRWAKASGESLQQIAPPIKERIGLDLQIAMVKCVERTLELLEDATTPRDTAYAAKCMSDAALDWLYGRKGSTVNVDARSGDTNIQVLQQLAGASLDDLRQIARGGE